MTDKKKPPRRGSLEAKLITAQEALAAAEAEHAALIEEHEPAIEEARAVQDAIEKKQKDLRTKIKAASNKALKRSGWADKGTAILLDFCGATPADVDLKALVVPGHDLLAEAYDTVEAWICGTDPKVLALKATLEGLGRECSQAYNALARAEHPVKQARDRVRRCNAEVRAVQQRILDRAPPRAKAGTKTAAPDKLGLARQLNARKRLRTVVAGASRYDRHKTPKLSEELQKALGLLGD